MLLYAYAALLFAAPGQREQQQQQHLLFGDSTTAQIDFHSPSHGAVFEADDGGVLKVLPVRLGLTIDGDSGAFAARHGETSTVCLAVGEQQMGCSPLTQVGDLAMRRVPVGRFELRAWMADRQGRRVGFTADSVAAFEVAPPPLPPRDACPGAPSVQLIAPRRRARVVGSALDAEVRLEPPPSCAGLGVAGGTRCGFGVSGGFGGGAYVVCAQAVPLDAREPQRQRQPLPLVACVPARPSNAAGSTFRAVLSLRGMAPGLYSLRAWLDGSGNGGVGSRGAAGSNAGVPAGGAACAAHQRSEVEVHLVPALAQVAAVTEAAGAAAAAAAAAGSAGEEGPMGGGGRGGLAELAADNDETGGPLAIVTAVSDKYVPSLANLVGSVHFWSPTVRVIVYSLQQSGLAPEVRARIARWRNVELRQLPFEHLPPHFGKLSSFAWKPWCILDALRRLPDGGSARQPLAPSVLWLDSAVELRRPLRGAALLHGGHFFTVSGFFFPTPANVFEGTLRRFGCSMTLARTPAPLHECAGGYQGYTRGGWAHVHVLEPLVRCAMDAACLTPPGSSRANHRQDQSILNALLCQHAVQRSLPGGATELPCQSDRRWWMWDDQASLLPTEDETLWKEEMVFFLRRRKDVQPYAKYLVEEEPPAMATVHVGVGGGAADSDSDVLFFT